MPMPMAPLTAERRPRWRNRRSIARSSASGSLVPSSPSSLIPLSGAGLWEAETIAPIRAAER